MSWDIQYLQFVFDILFVLISQNCGVVVVSGFTSVSTSASNILENSDTLFIREVLKVTLVISIAKEKVVVSTESADDPEGFECEILLSDHRMKLHFHMS